MLKHLFIHGSKCNPLMPKVLALTRLGTDERCGGFWDDFGRPKSSIFLFFSMFFSKHFSNSVLEGEKIEKKPAKTKRHGFWAGPAECAEPGGEREGEIRRSRPRLLKLSILGLIDIWPRL